MTINLTTLPAIVPGTDYARTLEGNTPAGIAATGFLGSDTLTATVFQGQNLPSIFAPTVTWFNPTLCQFLLQISKAQTALLASDTTYYLLVEASRGSVTYAVAECYIPTLPVPGSQMASTPPDLISIPSALRLLAMMNLTTAQFEMVPTLISAGSNAIRSWCKRRFDQGTVVEEVPVELGGMIRLNRPPINYVQRIQARLRTALTVSNSVADTAWVNMATTGDLAEGQVITGLVLNQESGGIVGSQVITYAPNQTINALAAAINAVGNGWTATTDTTLGLWPVTEIADGLASKGAGQNDLSTGAEFHVYSRNVTASRFHEDDGQRTGMIRIGREASGGIDWTWGPDAPVWYDSPGQETGRVKVTYNGGYAAIPPEVQDACAHLVQHELYQFKAPLILLSEKAGQYSYELNPRIVEEALPQRVLQKLTRYRITNA